jgi:hypothetical protein
MTGPVRWLGWWNCFTPFGIGSAEVAIDQAVLLAPAS